MPKLTASLATLPNVEESIDLEAIEFRMSTLNRALDVIDALFCSRENDSRFFSRRG